MKKIIFLSALLLSIILIVQVLVVGKVALSMFNKKKVEPGTAPDFINMELSEAQRIAGDMGANISVRLEEYSNTVSKNIRKSLLV